MSPDKPGRLDAHYDAVVVGAGFAGLYMLHRLRGLGLSARVFEAGQRRRRHLVLEPLSGRALRRREPGVLLLVLRRARSRSGTGPSATPPAGDPALPRTRRRPVRPAARHPVRHARHGGALRRGGQPLDGRRPTAARRVAARSHHGDRLPVVRATCRTSRARQLPGRSYHTGRWPHEGVDFTGQRVGVDRHRLVGIQAIPVIAEQAEHLTVFQRTPNFSCRRATARSTPKSGAGGRPNYAGAARRARAVDAQRHRVRHPRQRRARRDGRRGARQAVYEERWERGGLNFIGAFSDLFDKAANDTAAEFVREQDPRHRSRTRRSPSCCRRRDHPFGTKRLCVDTGYYETFNRRTSRWSMSATTPIEAITPDGHRGRAASEYELDAIVFATGFDAMTGALLRHRYQRRAAADARGQVGRRAAHLSRPDGGRLPEPVHDHRPGQPVGAHNMMVSIEQHVDWIADCIAYLREHGLDAHRGDGRGRGRAGSAHVNEVGATPRSSRRRTPGTWAPTSRASRACSCPISAASPLPRIATRSRPTATRASR